MIKLSPVFSQRLEEARQKGRQQARREIIESLLVSRFGELDSQLEVIIQQIMELPEEGYFRLILQLSNLSREELLARFEGEN